jgi:hypothetical protein
LRDYASEIKHSWEHFGAWAFVPEIYYYEGKALIELGQFGEARSILLKGLQKAEEIGLSLILWRIQSALSGLEMKEGKPKSAKKYLSQSGHTLQRIIEHIDNEALRDKFLSLEEVKKVWESG